MRRGAMTDVLPTDETVSAQTIFAAWLRHEMPPNTIIGDPDWWAPRIFLAVKRTVRGEGELEREIERLKTENTDLLAEITECARLLDADAPQMARRALHV